MTNTDVRRKLVLLLMGIFFLTVACVSVASRLISPGLTVSSFGRMQATEVISEKQSGGMGTLGELMRRASDNPDDIDALIKIAEIFARSGDFSNAESFARRAHSIDEKNAQALYLLGVINHNLGHHEEAARLIEDALRIDDTAASRYSLAILYIYYLNEPQKGLSNLKAGLSIAGIPDNMREHMQKEIYKLEMEQN